MTQRASIQEQLRQGIDAAKRGDKLAARRYLQQVLALDRNNEVAWMWMASAVDTVEERRRCLERALQINPNNERAREALKRLGVNPGETPAGNTPAARSYDYVPPTTRRRPNIYLIAAAAVAVLVAGIAIAGLVTNTSEPTAFVPEPTLETTLIGELTTPTLELETATPTLLPGIIVSFEAADIAQLPPTFTPTPSPTPSETPVPTQTPVPPPDMRIIYTDIAADEPNTILYTNNAQGGVEQSFDVQGYMDIVADPSGTRIAFVRTTTYNRGSTTITSPELFVAPIDNPNDADQITGMGGDSLTSPSWSPDGSQIAFASNADGDEDIYVISSSGGTPRLLTDNDTLDTEPDFSPDGELIAYTSDQDSPGFREIYTIGVESDAITRITDLSGNNFSPRWSPDGNRIAFVTDRSGSSEIYIMEASGENTRLLTINDGDAENVDPVWSPDGQWIAFRSNRAVSGWERKYQWYLMDIESGDARPIILTDREPQSLSFISNGR